mgnify:CR=1 FL=1
MFDAHCFAAIDFETANPRMDSACSVGVVRVVEGEIVSRWHRLIRPDRKWFLFTDIHGIRWEDVKNEPTFGELWPELKTQLEGAEFLAAHNADFDRMVLHRCCKTNGITPPRVPFRCTVKLVKKVWALRGAGLAAVCKALDIPLQHHHALSDAEACARIYIRAMNLLRSPKQRSLFDSVDE